MDGGAEGHATSGQRRKGLRAVWQKRFWAHTIRDELDFERHVDYIHYNPVRQDLAAYPHTWEWATFEKWVARGGYEAHWCCKCASAPARIPDFAAVASTVGE
jgi:putative transposase